MKDQDPASLDIVSLYLSLGIYFSREIHLGPGTDSMDLHIGITGTLVCEGGGISYTHKLFVLRQCVDILIPLLFFLAIFVKLLTHALLYLEKKSPVW